MGKVFYGWWVVGGAFVLLFCSVGSHYYAFPVFFEAMSREMGWARAETAAALSIGILVASLVGLLAGILVYKIKVRLIMVSGSIVAGIGFILLTTVTHLWQFHLFYGLILSAGIACIQMVPTMTAVGMWFEERRSTALGIATAGIGAGGAVMAPLAGWLISRYDCQTAFAVMAAIVILLTVPISAIVMRTPAEGKAVSRKHESETQHGIILSQAVKGKPFWLISIGVMLWSWAYSTGLIHQVAFVVDMGIDKVAAASTVSLVTGFSIPGRLGFGRLGDLIDKRYVFMMGTFLQMIAFIVLTRSTNLTMLYIYSLLLGVNIGGMTPILPGLIADYFGAKHFGAIFGASHFVLILGDAIGPIYGGWIFDTTGKYNTAFLSSIVLSFLAMICVYLVGKPQKTDTRI